VDAIEVRLDDRLIAGRTDAMAERRVTVLADVRLDANPVVLLVADLLAVHAGGQNTFEMFYSILNAYDAFRDDQPGLEFIRIERF
jgi:hypothetical protein